MEFLASPLELAFLLCVLMIVSLTYLGSLSGGQAFIRSLGGELANAIRLCFRKKAPPEIARQN